MSPYLKCELQWHLHNCCKYVRSDAYFKKKLFALIQLYSRHLLMLNIFLQYLRDVFILAVVIEHYLV